MLQLEVAIHDLQKIGEVGDLDVMEQGRFKALKGCLSLWMIRGKCSGDKRLGQLTLGRRT